MPSRANVSIEALGSPKPSADEYARLLEARAWASEQLLARRVDARPSTGAPQAGYDNIVGAGLGLKERGGKRLPQVAVRVFVRRKLAMDVVMTEARVPPEIRGVPTDVVEVGGFNVGAAIHPAPLTQYQVHRRPVPAGVSIGPCGYQETGTVAGLVRDGAGHTYILSNNHVLAHANLVALNTPIRQPGEIDGGTCPPHEVAHLRKYITIEFGRDSMNFVDAAIAEVVAGAFTPSMWREGQLVQLQPPLAAPALQVAVQKSGRTTGRTQGTITDVDVEAWVDYQGHIESAHFVGQFRVTGNGGAVFSQRGDSGSLVTTVAGEHPVGMLFTSDAAGSIAHPIEGVLRDLAGKIPQIDPLQFVYV